MVSSSLFLLVAIFLAFFVQTQSHQLFKFDDKVENTAITACNDDDAAIAFHKDDCSRFWKCKKPKAYLQVCIAGKKFDTKTLMCTSPKLATCRDSQGG